MTNFSKLVLKMTEYEGGCVERVNHFLKVFAFAKTIAEGEDVDDATKEILEAAAITHDIGIYAEELGIGFRVEDNCLVTPTGAENLSASVPRTIEDIEAVMAK